MWAAPASAPADRAQPAWAPCACILGTGGPWWAKLFAVIPNKMALRRNAGVEWQSRQGKWGLWGLALKVRLLAALAVPWNELPPGSRASA